ncbi:MAG: triose-phosphate isomerase [Patescibacteria group bacterium]|nr:triose-phosphate isomerase [Patescibacteria group bacterium]
MKRYLIANWKMQLNEADSAALASDIVKRIAPQVADSDKVVTVLCPSHLSIGEVADAVRGTAVGLGAQDVSWEDKGALTGEISPVTLKELGCAYCIVGHSERRQKLGETDEMVHKKAEALLRHDINPIICVGETKEERDAGKRDAVVIGQVRAALEGLRPVGNQDIVVAYEPVWVIGTGQAVEPNDAAEVHQLIRETLLEMLPADIVEQQCFVIYGGSIDSKNLAGFLEVPIIEGALIGGASLRADEFVRMTEIVLDMG